MTSQPMNSQPPFWFKQALAEENPPLQMPLGGDWETDVCIIGGGYTGLWTAIQIKIQSPETRVMIIEKGRCGQGASGRNGGCMLTFSTKFPSLMRFYGEEEAIRLVKASEQGVHEIAAFCEEHHIDAEVRIDGVIYTATNEVQRCQLSTPMKALSRYDINQWRELSTQEVVAQTGSRLNLAGITSSAGGSLHPGKLVLGLVRHGLSLGIEIFEDTEYQGITHGVRPEIQTNRGRITANRVVFAVNAWMGQYFREFNRYITLVSSDMLITPPMRDKLAAIGLDHGKAIADSRLFVHYYRTSADGRLMLGKGGNLFPFNNRMLPAFEQPSTCHGMLKQAFRQFFPELPSKIEQTWTGPSDRSSTGLPFFGCLSGEQNVFYGLGYSGNGVVQSFLGGKILSSLVLSLDNEWSHSPLVKGPLGRFPPEPVRYLGAQLVKRSVRRKEQAEDQGLRPGWMDCQLAKLAAVAGKADK